MDYVSYSEVSAAAYQEPLRKKASETGKVETKEKNRSTFKLLICVIIMISAYVLLSSIAFIAISVEISKLKSDDAAFQEAASGSLRLEDKLQHTAQLLNSSIDMLHTQLMAEIELRFENLGGGIFSNLDFPAVVNRVERISLEENEKTESAIIEWIKRASPQNGHFGNFDLNQIQVKIN